MFLFVLIIVGGAISLAVCCGCRSTRREETERDFRQHASCLRPVNSSQVRMVIRSAFQPFRIMTTYMQITFNKLTGLRVSFPTASQKLHIGHGWSNLGER